MQRFLSSTSLLLAILLLGLSPHQAAHAQQKQKKQKQKKQKKWKGEPPASSVDGTWRVVDESTGETRMLLALRERGGTPSGRVVRVRKGRGRVKGKAKSKAKGKGKDKDKGGPQRNAKGKFVCDACNGPKKNKRIKGMTLLKGLKREGGGEGSGREWGGGTMLNPSNGRTYKVNVTLLGKGDRLEVHRYSGTPIFGRTQTWHRVSRKRRASPGQGPK